MQVMEREELLTPREIAERYRVSEAMIRWNIRKGNLEAQQVGKLYRVPKSALERFLAGNKPEDKK